MRRAYASVFPLALAAALAACGGGAKPDEGAKEPAQGKGKVEETGKDLSKNPIAAIAQLGQAAKKASDDMQKAASRPPVDPVKFDVLLPYLPRPAAWKASEPQGSTTAMGEWKISVVSASYTKEGDDASSARVEIT